MRVSKNGNCFTVYFSEQDTQNFRYHWPASDVKGHGYFQFDNNEDLIDIKISGGSSIYKSIGSDWVAFMENCKQYGLSKLNNK